MKSLANEFFRTMEDGAKDYQKAHPGDFDLVANGIKNETDTGEQIRIVEQMVNSGAKALVIAPADSKALVSAVKKAMDQGVVVINIDNRLDPELLKSKGISVPFVGPDNRKGARMVGDYLAQQKLKAGDQVGIIEGVSTTTNAQQRTAGFKDAMDAAGMKIVSVQSGNWEIDKGNAVAASMLNEYPDLKALLAGNDSMALCRLGRARRRQDRPGAGGGLRQHQRHQANAQGWSRARHPRPGRQPAGGIRHSGSVEGAQG